MTNPTPLSPAAQGVWDAYNQFDHAGMHVDYGIKLAAALRAVADLVAPDDYKCFNGNLEWDAGMEACTDNIRENLLAIADELETQ